MKFIDRMLPAEMLLSPESNCYFMNGISVSVQVKVISGNQAFRNVLVFNPSVMVPKRPFLAELLLLQIIVVGLMGNFYCVNQQYQSPYCLVTSLPIWVILLLRK